MLLAGVVLAGCQAPPVLPGEVSTPAIEPRVPRVPRFGLGLGGGAARGSAHIGVIQVLEENAIRPSLVVGTSAGSLVLPPATPPEPAPLSTVVVATLVGEAERGLCEVAPGQPLAFVTPSWWYWWWAEWLEPWIA